MVVLVDELTIARLVLKTTLFLIATGLKFVPVIVTGVLAVPIVGVNPVIVGAPVELVTVKISAVVADPAGDVTAIGPVVAPEGTATTSWLALAEVMVAAMPLKLTVFWLAVVLNPVPKIVTVARQLDHFRE